MHVVAQYCDVLKAHTALYNIHNAPIYQVNMAILLQRKTCTPTKPISSNKHYFQHSSANTFKTLQLVSRTFVNTHMAFPRYVYKQTKGAQAQ